jgi:3-phosphoshikimate 1-carboxyvinyltransferase
MIATITPSKVSGTLSLPASKSAMHRALMCAGFAKGTSVLSATSTSKDIEATSACLKAMGADIQTNGRTMTVTGCNIENIHSPLTLDANESGSTLRFFIPVAACTDVPVTFHGKPSLLSRPMGVYADLFVSQNLKFDQSGQAIELQGPLQPGLFTLPGDISSQFVTGLLYASVLLGGSEIAVLPPFESAAYVDMTVEMMKTFGVDVQRPTELGFAVPEGSAFVPADVSIEPDYSQLAFFAVLAALNAPLSFTSLQEKTLQGDAVILDILEKSGAKITRENGLLTVAPGIRIPFTADLSSCPDLGPALCVLAAFLPGTSRIVNAGRLRIKECDRIEAMENELKKWGVDISSTEDSITITGKESYQSRTPVVIDAHNDHRVVMAMSVFGLCADGTTVIENAQAVEKSYPDFFEDLEKIHGKAVLS